MGLLQWIGLGIIVAGGIIFFSNLKNITAGGDEEYDDEDNTVKNPIQQNPAVTAPVRKTPATATPAAAGQVLYDSNKGWTAVRTAASGNPKFTSMAGGVGKLACGKGHCRIYIDVKNYNSRMEVEFMTEGSVDNCSFRLRSRHGEGGACENRFGGFGATVYPKTGEVKFQTESCHNNHENTITGKIPPLSQGWHKVAYSCYDSPDKKSVNFKLAVDGKTVLTGKHSSPKPYYMNEALHMQKNSYIWLRSNNSGNGVAYFRNLKLYNLGRTATAATATATAATTSTQFLNLRFSNPYLYNSFYNRRRL